MITTVEELIEELKKFPPKAGIEIAYTNQATDHWSSDREEEDYIHTVREECNTVLICNHMRTKP